MSEEFHPEIGNQYPYRIEKKWGHEVVLWNEEYCCKLLNYEREGSSSLHYHPEKTETFYVTSGSFRIRWGESDVPENERLFGPGSALHLPAGTRHQVTCLRAPGTILECSSHDDPEDCVRLVPSEDPK